jgi:hypothetical protein
MGKFGADQDARPRTQELLIPFMVMLPWGLLGTSCAFYLATVRNTSTMKGICNAQVFAGCAGPPDGITARRLLVQRNNCGGPLGFRFRP